MKTATRIFRLTWPLALRKEVFVGTPEEEGKDWPGDDWIDEKFLKDLFQMYGVKVEVEDITSNIGRTAIVKPQGGQNQ